MLRRWLCGAALERATEAVQRCVRGPHVLDAGSPYPTPGAQYTLKPGNIEEPDLAAVACHPGLVEGARAGDQALRAVALWLDDTVLRGIGQSKRRAAPQRSRRQQGTGTGAGGAWREEGVNANRERDRERGTRCGAGFAEKG